MQWKWKIQLDNIREYVVGENQQQHYTFVFDEKTKETAVSLCFFIQANANLTVYLLIAYTSMRVKIEIILRGAGAHAHIYGAYMLSDAHAVKIDTVQHHEAAHTSSNLIIKGALRDSSSAHYYGTIRVEKEARGAYASQENKNILLSSTARAVSVPNLEVLTNEVKCFHGSAIGTFDAQQLFYAASRGIDEKTAERILLEAFFADVVEEKGLSL